MRKVSKFLLPLVALGLLSLWAFSQETILPRPVGGGSGTSTNGLSTISYVDSTSNALAIRMGGTNVLGTTIIYVDPVTGSDATGVRGNATKPFLTYAGAAAAAISTATDWIWLRPGTYNETFYNGVRGVYCEPGVNNFYADGAGVSINPGASDDFTVLGYCRFRNGGFAQNWIAGGPYTISIECQEFVGTNGGAVFWQSATGTNYIFVRELLSGRQTAGAACGTVTNTAVRKMYITAAEVSGILCQGSNSIVYANGVNINSVAAGIAMNNGASVYGSGKIHAGTDGISGRTNCYARWVGNVESEVDTPCFVENNSAIDLTGNATALAINGNYQLAGNAAGCFAASGRINIVGNVTAPMPIVCNDGNVTVIGNLYVTNFVAPVFLPYSGETLYVNANYQPNDLATNCVNVPVNLMGSGRVIIKGDVYTPSNSVARLSRTATGVVEFHDGTIQSVDSTRNTSLIQFDGGSLRFSNVRGISPAAFTNSISSTNGLKSVEIYATSSMDKALNSNVGITNGLLQIGNILYTSQPLNVDGSDFGTVPVVSILSRSAQTTNLHSWGVTNGTGAPIQLGGVDSNGIVQAMISGSALTYPAQYTMWSMKLDGSVTNITTTTNTLFGSTNFGSRLIPSGFFKVGRKVYVEISGQYFTPATPGNCLLVAMLTTSSATNTLVSKLFTPTASVTGDSFYGDFTLTCLTNSATVGALQLVGKLNTLNAGAAIYRNFTNTVFIGDTINTAYTLDFGMTNGASTDSWQGKDGGFYLR